MSKGIDVNADCTAIAGELKRDGFVFVGRYLGPIKTEAGKGLTLAEAQHLSSQGLYIVSLWENGFPNTASYFTPEKGASDGTLLVEWAERVGQPHGTPVYVTVDENLPPSDVLPYFAALHTAVDSKYLVGVYGSGDVCSAVLNAGTAHLAWLAGAPDWDGTKHFKASRRAVIVQGVGTPIAGLDADPDESNGSAGGWHIVPPIA